MNEAERARSAKELVALTPDVILAAASPSIAALLQVTRSVPIVFASVIDPVGAGYVKSLARPGGNATGFTAFEYSISAKWLELLKQIAPHVVRVAVLRDPALAAGIGQFAVIQSVASPSNVDVSVIDTRDASDIERGLGEFASKPGGGVIVTASSSAIENRQLIISLVTQYRLPNVHPYRYYVAGRRFGVLRARSERRVQTSGRSTSIAFSRARMRAIYRFSRPRKTGWSSTSKPPRRSA